MRESERVCVCERERAYERESVEERILRGYGQRESDMERGREGGREGGRE